MKLYSTTNYDIFKSLPHNRGGKPLNKQHLRELEQSVREKNLLPVRPIVVNGEHTVIDGAHRLEVAKRLGFAIYYVIHESDYRDAMRLTRGTTNWSTTSYIECWAANNAPEYVKLRNFLMEYGITIHVFFRLISRLGHNKKLAKSIKEGTFVFTEEMQAMAPTLVRCSQIIRALKDSGFRAEKLKRGEMWAASFACMMHPDCDAEKFVQTICDHPHEITREFSSWETVVSSLVRCYNRRLKKKKLDALDIIKRKFTPRNPHGN